MKSKDNEFEEIDNLIDIYSGYVLTIVKNILVGKMSSEDIEECVSDVFVKLWKQQPKINSDTVKGYIGTIARNTAKNKLRELRCEISLDNNEIEIRDMSDLEYNSSVTELCDVLHDAVDTFDAQDRELFIRYYYNYEPKKSISQNMKISEGNVKVKLFRLRKKV